MTFYSKSLNGKNFSEVSKIIVAKSFQIHAF
jgi:hypothetical protein